MRTIILLLLPLLVASCMHAPPLVKTPYDRIQHWIDQEYGVMEFGCDLNGDGRDELFVGSAADTNTGGDLFSIYEKQPDGWRYLGDIFMMQFHVDSTTSLGYHDIRARVRNGCGGCTISRYQWNGRAYIESDVKHYDFFKGEHPDPEVWNWEYGSALARNQEE